MILFRAEAKIFLVVEQVQGVVAIERDTKCEQNLERSASILLCRPNKQVKVIGGAQVPVCVDGNSTNDHVVNVGGEKRGVE